MILAAVFAIAATSSTPSSAPIVARAESCLQSHADEIAAMDRSLDSAASFLVNYVCAKEVEVASRYLRNQQMVDLLVAASPNGSKVTADPETGQLHVPPEPGKNPMDGLGAVSILQSAFPVGVAPELRAFAGSAILSPRSRVRR